MAGYLRSAIILVLFLLSALGAVCMDMVYLETSIISYLTANPSRDLIFTAHQQVTQEWWLARQRFHLFVSEVVVNEISQGDPQAAEKRLQTIIDIDLLELSQEAKYFASELIRLKLVPEKALVDALHIGIAVLNGMNYLLSWNCKHIAHAVVRPKIEAYCRANGLHVPVICTPEELLEFDDEK